MNIDVIPGINYSAGGAAFNAAVQYVVNLYDSLFTADVTVYINVDYGQIDNNNSTVPPLGESTSNFDSVSYSTVRQALINLNTPGSDTLPANSPLSSTLWLTTAQEKALGLLPPTFKPGNNYPYPGIDGYVGIASNAALNNFQSGDSWSFTPTATPASNQFYIVGALEHEFTEVLGRVSYDGSKAFGNAPSYSIMDLFRYSSVGVRQLSATSSPAYFSTDNGNHVYSYWNTHASSFDTSGDLGDWWSSGPNNFDPTGPDAYLDESPPGQINGITTNDKIVMNAIGWTEPPPPNSPPSAGTTADMILRNGTNGNFEIYDIGSNAISAGYPLGHVGLEYVFVGLGGFNGTDTTDMILRNSNTGAFEVYDISDNNITGAAALGQVGTEWRVAGFGDFSTRAGETDMMMRNANNGVFEVYDIGNNAITGASAIGQVGLEWQVAGFGDFSTRTNESDMLLRNVNSGAFEVYDIAGNALISAASMGVVGSEWKVVGFGDFSGNANETDMMMRNIFNGTFELYNIRNNAIAGANAIGNVGLEWQVAGFGPLNGAGSADMVLRNSNNGAFEVYDIANSRLTTAASLGQVGLEWQLGGFAVDPPTGSAAASTAQLVQAMASFGASEPVSSTPVDAVASADPSRQTLLTIPQPT